VRGGMAPTEAEEEEELTKKQKDGCNTLTHLTHLLLALASECPHQQLGRTDGRTRFLGASIALSADKIAL
jgi:hypothetical protein